MYFVNRLGYKCQLDIKAGDEVEIITRSSLYCTGDQEPEFYIGVVSEIIFEEYIDGKHPIGLYVRYETGSAEDELVMFSEIEDVFKKKFEIAGYGMTNEGMTLSIKGEGIRRIIRYLYQNGSLLPKSITDENIGEERLISESDKELIGDISKYGTVQKFSHFVLSSSK